MEETEEKVEEEMEQDCATPVKSAPEATDEDETSLLAPESGDEEYEEDVEQEVQEELLKEEVETASQEEVTVKEMGEEEMEEEQRGSEVLTFLDVKDHTDPLNVNQTNIFSSLAINSPKDTIMSDNVATDENANSKAEAKASLVAKANPGSDKSQQADALNVNNASAVEAYGKEKEKQETDMESEEEEREEMVEEEEEEEEVKIVEEVQGRKEEIEEAAKMRRGTGTPMMGGTDCRFPEVKEIVKS